jgi:hypothetical protein
MSLRMTLKYLHCIYKLVMSASYWYMDAAGIVEQIDMHIMCFVCNENEAAQ